MTSSQRSGMISAILVVISFSAASVKSTESNLTFVSVIFRHGDRTPDNNGYEMYPTDPYLNSSFYPTGLGQLTNNGKNREFQLGKLLKEKYGHYLGDIYTPNSTFALSSDYDRTKMSLQLVLAALFPPKGIQQWSKSVNWQPIPTKYLKRTEDNLFLSDECPLFKKQYNKVLNSPEIKRALSKYSALSEFLTKKTGRNISKPLDFYYLYLTLVAESSMGLELPTWTKDIFPHGALFDSTILAYRIANYNTLLRRLYAGGFLRSITETMKGIRSGTLEDRRKIYLFSGHETNIASMLFALKVYEAHVPEFSSAVITELHNLNGTYYVKFLHYLGIPAQFKELKLPECDVLCKLDDFLKIVANLIPSDEELSCDKSLTSDYANYRLPQQTESRAYNLIKTAKH